MPRVMSVTAYLTFSSKFNHAFEDAARELRDQLMPLLAVMSSLKYL